jgi:hypothetical protein
VADRLELQPPPQWLARLVDASYLIVGALLEAILLVGWAECPGPLPIEATREEAMRWIFVRRCARRGIREIERDLRRVTAAPDV